MKWMTMLVMVGLLAGTGCKKKEAEPVLIEPTSNVLPGVVSEPLAAESGETLEVFDIGGMTCSGCQETVYGAICAVPGVKRASVSLDEKKAWVVGDETTAPTPEAIVAAVKDSSYEATLATP